MPAQRVELVVAHYAGGLTGLDHVVNDGQRLAYPRAAVDDVAEEQRHASRMSPAAVLEVVTELLEEPLQGPGTAVDVADQVVATRRVEHQPSPVPSRLPQPSLVRQVS